MSGPPWSGALNLLKPPGMSSHDVVAFVRRLLKQRQVGHGGTLDPGAAGVLPVFLGAATRLIPFLPPQWKRYRAEMTLGVRTDTGDSWGRTEEIRTDFRISPARLGEVLAGMVGEQLQAPPLVSAVRYQGKRLYELYRQGQQPPAVPPRRVVIDEIHVIRIIPDNPFELGFGTRILLDISCSPGTYIRSLCADAGERLGCGAHLSFLVRTASGPYVLEEASTLDELEAAVAQGELERLLVSPAEMMAHLPGFRVEDETTMKRLQHGSAVVLDGRRPGGAGAAERASPGAGRFGPGVGQARPAGLPGPARAGAGQRPAPVAAGPGAGPARRG